MKNIETNSNKTLVKYHAEYNVGSLLEYLLIPKKTKNNPISVTIALYALVVQSVM